MNSFAAERTHAVARPAVDTTPTGPTDGSIQLSRRSLLLSGVGAALGLHLGASPGCSPNGGLDLAIDPMSEDLGKPLGLWVRMGADGRVTLVNPAIEMGQGSRTALARVLSQALDLDWSQVQVVDAPYDEAYGSARFGGKLVTADSAATREFTPLLQTAGAQVRAALMAAAARRWQCTPQALRTSAGRVEPPDGRADLAALPYLALIEDADLAAAPDPASLIPPATRQVGVDVRRVDLPDKLNGKACFGVDGRPPEVPVALLARGPWPGAKPLGMDDRAALAVPGVQAVLKLDDAVAVVARDTWSAIQGRRALQLRWRETEGPAYDSEATLKAFAALAADAAQTGYRVQPAAPTHTEVEPDPGPASAPDTGRVGQARVQHWQATYLARHVTHACMEPLNTLLRPRLWGQGAKAMSSTQAPSLDMRAIARAMKTAPFLIEVDHCLVGGAYGRRVDNSAAVDAARVAKALGGPVQALWLPGDDIAHGQVRSIAAVHLSAQLDAQGRLLQWRHRTVADSTIARMFPERFAQEGGLDQTMVDGSQAPYRCADQRIEYLRRPTGLPNGFLRGVGAGFNVFGIESFVDELALLAGQDPLAWRLAHLDRPAHRRVLQALAERCVWPAHGSAGRALGLAFMDFRGSIVATAAEVERTGQEPQDWRPTRMWVVLDCGLAVQPDAVKAQVEGAAAMGTGFALREVLHVRGGRRHVDSVAAYGPVRGHELPRIDVMLVAGEPRPPQGVGEVGLPGVAPALANALVRLGGSREGRRRELPLKA